MKIIEPNVDERLGEWYGIRNRIIHRLIAYSYHNYEWNRVTRKEVDVGFKKG